MASIPIYFFSEDTDYQQENKLNLKAWIKESLLNERFKLTELNFIFCSDAYLLGLNQTYLSHHTLTDVISFDHSKKKGSVEADIFISIERVRENALRYKEEEADELHRVMIHGCLHLCGYRDKSSQDKIRMRERENFYLLKRSFL